MIGEGVLGGCGSQSHGKRSQDREEERNGGQNPWW